MLPEAVNTELSRDPFVPLKLHLSNGRSVTVRKPGLYFVNRGSLYMARIDRPHSRLADDVDLISLRHIVRIEQVASDEAA